MKRFVIYYDEGIKGGPKVEMRELNGHMFKTFPAEEGWTAEDWIKIDDMVVREAIYSSQSGATFDVMILRVK